uniref:Uncharacterized protein n=1 Tax=Ciona intestinalis TaxID=7719 RepID=H2XJJ2_CIOIN
MPIQGNDKEIYDALERFDSNDFLKFARTHLQLTNREIQVITKNNINNGVDEQQFQIVLKWMRQNERANTVEKLKIKADSFF